MRPRSPLFGPVALLALLAAGAPRAAADEPAPSAFAAEVVPFLSKHCYACHGNGKKRGDVTLDRARDDEAVRQDRQVWENVVQLVRTGVMPPKGRPRPDAAEVGPALRALDRILAASDCGGPRNPGRVTLRRLNRAEYNNTVRDLTGVDFQPADDFPNDDVGYGFDNIGDVLSLSPLLLEKYLAAAEEVLDRAIVSTEPPKPTKNRLGGLRVSFLAGDARTGPAPFLHSAGEVFADSYFDEGDYVIRVETFAQQAGDEPVRAVLRVARTDVKEFTVTADRSAPATLEATVRIRAGTSRISVAFVNPLEDRPNDPTGRRLLYVRGIETEGPFNAPPPALPESHRRIMAHRPGLPPREAARAIVARFAARAFRRPVRPEEVEHFLTLYDRAEEEGEGFERRVRLALCGVLVSPHFLFLVELDPPGARPGTAYPVGDYELASRLSYFLWSSMPDDELLTLAEKGRLRQELDAQVRRLVRDPRSAAFVQNFAGQWLTLRGLANASPDPKVFPNFDDELRSAMLRETELFFESVVREDRSAFDLLDADFTFVNERLARHYGIPGVKGKEFRRVPAPPGRGGILTQASVLTLTSHPTRTSPVKRGKWVLDQILNTPPPPPPPDVPPLAETGRLTGSLRRVMEQHRENALCASCHARMDPIGFAFENYDAVGAWRERDGDFPIDPSGTLPDGRSFKGPAELKEILKGQKDLFRRCLAEKVLTYALGRGLEAYDRCAVDRIVEAMAANDDRFSTLLAEVVRSEPFLMRTATGGKP